MAGLGSTPELARVHAAAEQAAAARRELLESILEARAGGASLRAIGAAAHLSPERVRQLTAGEELEHAVRGRTPAA